MILQGNQGLIFMNLEYFMCMLNGKAQEAVFYRTIHSYMKVVRFILYILLMKSFQNNLSI